MSINDYRIFVEVAKQGSFTRAAEKLSLTPSAVSHSILKMERHYGIMMFHRLNNSVELTHEGELLLPGACRILRSEELIGETLDKIHGRKTGRVRIGAFNSVCVNYLATLTTRFRAKYPDIEVQIYQGGYKDISNWLNDYIVDVGFISDMEPMEFPRAPLMRDQIYCVTPKDFETSDGSSISVEEIQRYPLVMQRDDYGYESARVLDALGIKGSISNCEAIDDASILAIVESGLGVSFLPELVLNRMEFEVNRYSLDPPMYRRIDLAYQKENELSPAAKLMIKHIQEFFEPMQGTLER